MLDYTISVSDNSSTRSVTELKTDYTLPAESPQWVEVLVDCTGVQQLFTYTIPTYLKVQPGDILVVPFNHRTIGGIAIRCLSEPPKNQNVDKWKDIEDVVATDFFPPYYWELLTRVADYYQAHIIQAVRTALPPRLLERSQRRIRLEHDAIPGNVKDFLTSTAWRLFNFLNNAESDSYSWKYISKKIPNASKGLSQLTQRGWAKSYIEPPKPIKPKYKKAVILLSREMPETIQELSDRALEVRAEMVEILRRRRGEAWLKDIVQACRTTSKTLELLETTGCIAIEDREVLRTLTPFEVEADRPKELNEDQQRALDTINNLEGYTKVLLHGVTGSGKTEVYLQAIAPILETRKSALVLVPEIGLTPQLTDRFRARFGDRVCVYHSGLSDGERYDTWRQMLVGEPQVVIGTRSAIFAPLPHLGLIILDEEHDSSFKQDRPAPTYHARTVAQWRAELVNCPLILGSATPSLETWIDVFGDREHGEELHATTDTLRANAVRPYSLYLSLPQRIHSRPLPPVEIVDMRQEFHCGNRSIFSRSLQKALSQLQERDRQGILFVQRRGHSTFVSCRTCGEAIECPRCDVSLSYHYVREGANQLLRCHYCNHTRSHPKNCPECGSPYLKFFGSGTQKVMQELAKQFPNLRSIRFDSDTTRTKGSHRSLLTRFANKEADLLVGTQMLTKGLDLPSVSVVGIVAADGLLHLSDFRAAERAFQTLTQVSGRAGRGDDPGQAILQTYSPEHPVVLAVREGNYKAFVESELEAREVLNYPPYGRLILVRLTSTNPEEVEAAADRIADRLKPPDYTYELLGPAPAPVMRVADRYRWHILLKLTRNREVFLPELAELKALCPQSVSVAIDVDPLNLN